MEGGAGGAASASKRDYNMTLRQPIAALISLGTKIEGGSYFVTEAR